MRSDSSFGFVCSSTRQWIMEQECGADEQNCKNRWVEFNWYSRMNNRSAIWILNVQVTSRNLLTFNPCAKKLPKSFSLNFKQIYLMLITTFRIIAFHVEWNVFTDLIWRLKDLSSLMYKVTSNKRKTKHGVMLKITFY